MLPDGAKTFRHVGRHPASEQAPELVSPACRSPTECGRNPSLREHPRRSVQHELAIALGCSWRGRTLRSLHHRSTGAKLYKARLRSSSSGAQLLLRRTFAPLVFQHLLRLSLSRRQGYPLEFPRLPVSVSALNRVSRNMAGAA